MELVAKAGSLLQASLLLCETQHIGRESWAGFLPPLVKQAHDDPSQGGQLLRLPVAETQALSRQRHSQLRQWNNGWRACTRTGLAASKGCSCLLPTLHFSLEQDKSAPATSPAQAAATSGAAE